MTKQVCASPRNKKAFANQMAIQARLEKSRKKGESKFREGGKRLRNSKRIRH